MANGRRVWQWAGGVWAVLVVAGGTLTLVLSPPAPGSTTAPHEDHRPGAETSGVPVVGPSQGADFGWCGTPEPVPPSPS
ncbi:hypothetical protein, partial [Streptomyces sp. PU-14G]|uniref:hypothetical protein n=1 Tax=Streptomyces sp. PU-14G TaxID=2800808 RepID=UPI0034DE959C